MFFTRTATTTKTKAQSLVIQVGTAVTVDGKATGLDFIHTLLTNYEPLLSAVPHSRKITQFHLKRRVSNQHRVNTLTR